MDKARLEAFSDGVFSIAITLLIFDIKVPILTTGSLSNAVLGHQLSSLVPQILIFVVSFMVLSVFWINHHYLFHSFAKKIDRGLNLLNLLFLMLVVFVPFSAEFIGTYPSFEVASIEYGLNLFSIMLVVVAMLQYILRTPGMLSEDISRRVIRQSRFRGQLSLFCYFIGLVFSFINVHVSTFFYLFPVIFNIIPGTLNFTERLFRFKLD